MKDLHSKTLYTHEHTYIHTYTRTHRLLGFHFSPFYTPCVAVDLGSWHTAIGKLNCWLSPRSHSERPHVVQLHIASGQEASLTVSKRSNHSPAVIAVQGRTVSCCAFLFLCVCITFFKENFAHCKRFLNLTVSGLKRVMLHGLASSMCHSLNLLPPLFCPTFYLYCINVKRM